MSFNFITRCTYTACSSVEIALSATGHYLSLPQFDMDYSDDRRQLVEARRNFGLAQLASGVALLAIGLFARAVTGKRPNRAFFHAGVLGTHGALNVVRSFAEDKANEALDQDSSVRGCMWRGLLFGYDLNCIMRGRRLVAYPC